MTAACRHCGGALIPEERQHLFRDPDNPTKLEFHTLNMARFLAGKNGHLEGDVVTWHGAARGSKLGLITGYSYTTGKLGYKGEGVYCGMSCALASGKSETPGRARATRKRLPPKRAALKINPAELTGPKLKQIRLALKLSGPEFATKLGYTGTAAARQVIISRFERGAREIPPAIARLACYMARP